MNWPVIISFVRNNIIKQPRHYNYCCRCFSNFADYRQKTHVRWSSTKGGSSRTSIQKSDRESSSEVSTTLHTVKETTKTASYTGVILIGVGVTGMLFYTIFKELFSNKSPNCVYAKALDKCIGDSRVVDSLGDPIKGYGEETRRGRRRHVSHLLYEKDGVNYLRMKFYIKGSRRRATVHLEMKENQQGNYDYRYLFVQLDDPPHFSIILEDNRADVGRPMEVLPELNLTD